MPDKIHVGVLGAMGRMGQILVKAILKTPGLDLSAGSEREGHPHVGGAIPGTDAPLFDTARDVFRASDIVIDFSSPGCTAAHAAMAADMGTALIIGTTGLSQEDHAAIDAAAEKIAVFQAENMSPGVNLLTALVQRVSRALESAWDIEIVETHHREKVDSPSGTALMLGEAAARGRGVQHQEVAERNRDGITGARRPGNIGYASVRGGGVIGEHTVGFYSKSERIELSHRAENRDLFADGAMQAVLWIGGREAGRYTMLDVLGIV